MNALIRLAIFWGVNTLFLWFASTVVSGLSFGSLQALLVAGLVFGLVNAVVKPLLVLLTLPLTIITLGIFIVVVNAFMLWLVAALVPGFNITGFGSAVLAAICISVFAIVLHVLFGLKP